MHILRLQESQACLQFEAGHSPHQREMFFVLGHRWDGREPLESLGRSSYTFSSCGVHFCSASVTDFRYDAEPTSLPNRYLGVRAAGNGQYIAQVII